MDNLQVVSAQTTDIVVTFLENNMARSTGRFYHLTNNVIYTYDEYDQIEFIDIYLDTGTAAEVFLCTDPSATLTCSSAFATIK